MLGPGEDEGLVDPAARDQLGEELALALPVDRMDDLPDELDGGVSRCHLDLRRSVEDAVREAPDVIGEGRAEQEVLAPWREQADDLADVPDEAHVEHPVGLVEDEDLDPGEVDRALADVVEQPPGGGHHDAGPGPQGAQPAPRSRHRRR